MELILAVAMFLGTETASGFEAVHQAPTSATALCDPGLDPEWMRRIDRLISGCGGSTAPSAANPPELAITTSKF
jgi:hypothetical protein